MRRDAKTAFAESEKDGKMKKRVRGKLMKLYPVSEEETTKKRVKRETEAAKKVIKEHNTIAWRRIWKHLGSWHQ